MLFAFRQQDGRAAFFHSHEHIIDNLIITFVIGDQHSVEFLNAQICRLRGRVKTGLTDDESMIERALFHLATRISSESNGVALGVFSKGY